MRDMLGRDEVTERRACRVLGQARNTQRRKASVADDEPRLVKRIVWMASEYGRYGYRRIMAKGLLPSVFSLWLQPARTTLLTRPPPPSSNREYTPAWSADRHRTEAHWRKPSILSPAVTATGTTF